MTAGIVYPYPIHRERYHWPTFSDAEFARRHRVTRAFMEENGLDCLLVMGHNGIWERGWANVRWLTGFTGSNGLAVVGRDGTRRFVTDFRYLTQSADELVEIIYDDGPGDTTVVPAGPEIPRDWPRPQLPRPSIPPDRA